MDTAPGLENESWMHYINAHISDWQTPAAGNQESNHSEVKKPTEHLSRVLIVHDIDDHTGDNRINRKQPRQNNVLIKTAILNSW